jgi:very-short-patch-repair endonuclease
MSRVPNFIDSNDLVKLYESGLSLQKLTSQFHTSDRRLIGILKDSGVSLRQSRSWKNIPAQEAIDCYVSGVSEKKTAERFGVGRGAIRNMLVANGVHIRHQSESERLKWSQMSNDRRDAQVEAAHKVTKGRHASTEERVKHAQTCFKQGSHSTETEKLLMNWLSCRGIETLGQFPVGIYNLDIAINEPRIAVELFGGSWHASGYHALRHIERFKYLLDQGWNVMIIWIDTRNHPLRPLVCNNIISFMDELRSNVSLPRQYRVIWGDGQPAPTNRSKFNDISTIEALGCRR